jgi:hypothetical protein
VFEVAIGGVLYWIILQYIRHGWFQESNMAAHSK